MDMEPDGRPRKGRPNRDSTHPLGAHLRAMRERRGLTLRELAARVGLEPSAAGYLSQLENGTKVPSSRVAAKLAEVLGDDPRVYELWSKLGKRADFLETAGAVANLVQLGFDFESERELRARAERERESMVPKVDRRRIDEGPILLRARSSRTDVSPMMRLPTHAEGPEPASALSPMLSDAGAEEPPAAPHRRGLWPSFKGLVQALSPPSRRVAARSPAPPAFAVVPVAHPADPDRVDPEGRRLRLDPSLIKAADRLRRPFALRLDDALVRRVPDLLPPGDYAVLTREVLPLASGAVHAVRTEAGLELGLVVWNGGELLLLPAEGHSDFLVLPAPDERALLRLLAGRVAFTVPAPEA